MWSVSFSPDGSRIASGGEDETVRLWTLSGTLAAAPFKGHIGNVWTVAFSPDGTRIVSGGMDSTVRLWALNGEPVAEPIRGRSRTALSAAFSPDARRIVSSNLNNTVRLWALDGGQASEAFKGLSGLAYSMAFSPDGRRIVSGGEDGTVRLWTLDGKPAAEPFKGHAGLVYSVAFSPDGTRIVSGGEDGTVRLWTLDGKLAAEPFQGHNGFVLSVAFSPDGTRIVSGGADGTVRLWTVDGAPAAAPFKGHVGVVWSVVFLPDGMRVASGGEDGTIRVWKLDGTPAAAPFKGHDGLVRSVAFSPDGARIVSGGEDGDVRLWDTSAGSSSILHHCYAKAGLGFVDNRLFWIGCTDRIVISSVSLEPRGEIFLHEEGLVALLYGEGVYLPSDRIRDPFRKVSAENAVDSQHRAVPEVSPERLRQILLDEWTLPERFCDFMKDAYAGARTGYEWLGWWKVPFWLALAWATAVVISVAVWFFAPHKLATWSMPTVGSPEIPTWKWLAEILALFGYLGTTKRSLRAWLRKHRDALYAQNFAGRRPVKEREKYCSLGHEAEIEAFNADLSRRRGPCIWINGVGGSGKSALAYRMLRIATVGKASFALPVLVDEDWNGALLDQVVRLLRVGNRIPTAKMVEVLGSRGDLCLLIDSLSERGMSHAVDRVGDEVAKGNFTSVVVTSRQPLPDGHVWQTFKSIFALPLTSAQISEYVATYAPPERSTEVLGQILPLTAASEFLSPLFVRFAIEQALVGQVTAASTLDLVLQYVEALRAGRLDLNADDMLRAASIAATEAVRESLAPREIEQAYLRGVLVKEADALAFMNVRNTAAFDPGAIIEMLVDCGLLNRNATNRRLQFAYDPVAEHLAARWAAQEAPGAGVAPLRERILSEPDSVIARVMRGMESSFRLHPSEPRPAAAASI